MSDPGEGWQWLHISAITVDDDANVTLEWPVDQMDPAIRRNDDAYGYIIVTTTDLATTDPWDEIYEGARYVQPLDAVFVRDAVDLSAGHHRAEISASTPTPDTARFFRLKVMRTSLMK